MKKVMFFLLTLLVASTASAAQESLLLRTAEVTAVSTDLGDWATTLVAIHQGGHETNPIYTWVHRESLMVGLGVAVDAAGILGIPKLMGPRHPKIATSLLLAVTAMEAGCIVRNVNTIKTMNARQVPVMPLIVFKF